jgi:hypothetical protein
MLSWTAARDHCRGLGMHLASVTSSAQNQALTAAMKAQVVGANHFWLGGSDAQVEGRWTWSDGSTWGYSNWVPGEPNGGTSESCANVWTSSDYTGLWNDLACSGQLGFACKAASGCKHARSQSTCPAAASVPPSVDHVDAFLEQLLQLQRPATARTLSINAAKRLRPQLAPPNRQLPCCMDRPPQARALSPSSASAALIT